MNKLVNEPLEIRNSILIDSIFRPNQHLWNGYLGNESDFNDWLSNVAFAELDSYNLKAEKINLQQLNSQFFETASLMEEFTKHNSKGKWYIFFGPKWTNLGGFADGTMFIDLAFESNKSLEDITIFLPHEINHQIYSNTTDRNDNAVLHRILDEGFACYVSHLFHNGETTIAEELGYSESEYIMSVENENEVMELLRTNYRSNDENLSRMFAARSYRFSENFPAAIGYFIGYRIVEEFVKRNGKESWKRIYDISPEEVLKESRILE
ncbi:MAG: DUF2268 domain-containing putative Zn-dependent protease [Cyclobacteriaceae bacterium]